MIRRRRRPTREIPFSFDSFLDLVMNVVGVIVRLILVVWVGAKAYNTLQVIPSLTTPVPRQVAELKPIDDPLQAELKHQQQELEKARALLLEQLRDVPPLEAEQAKAARELADVQARRRTIEEQRAGLDKTAKAPAPALSLEELKQRRQKLLNETRTLSSLPLATKALRYRTPVSAPVDAEEFFFECKDGKVSFVDIGAMLADVRQSVDEKAKVLKSRWEVSDATAPAGAFRMKYTMERQRGSMDSVAAAPVDAGGFRYGLTEWQVEPVTEQRGESLEAALSKDSQFRHVVDRLDPQLAAVTFWVYPDSFAIYRELRDYLYRRDLTVAGRPLPFGQAIAASRKGTRSQGQ